MRLRGKSFKGKWTLGAWAEGHILSALNSTASLRALRYGKSEAIEPGAAGRGDASPSTVGKRPDFLLFSKDRFGRLRRIYGSAVLKRLPHLPDEAIRPIVRAAILGIEAEASIWEGRKMPDYGRSWDVGNGKRKPVRDLKSWIAPTLIVKDEDLQPLRAWTRAFSKPIYIVHLFLDLAFVLSFARFAEFIRNRTAVAVNQDFGDSTKRIYKVFYGLANEFGQFTKRGTVRAFKYQTPGGKFKSDLYFAGGRLKISTRVVQEWSSLLRGRR